MNGLYVLKTHIQDEYYKTEIKSYYDITMSEALRLIKTMEKSNVKIIRYEIILKSSN